MLLRHLFVIKWTNLLLRNTIDNIIDDVNKGINMNKYVFDVIDARAFENAEWSWPYLQITHGRW